MDTSQTLDPQAALVADSQLGLPDIPSAYPELVSLAQLRTEKNMTPEFAAASLRLSTAQILALEQQNWQRLPGPAYIKGFLRSYCKFLHADAQPYLDQYAQSLPAAQLPIQSPPSAAPIAPAIAPAAVAAVLGDPQLSLAHFDEADESSLQRKRVFWAAFGLIGATLVFLLIWERAMWLPSVQLQLSQWFPAQSVVSSPSLPALPKQSAGAAPQAMPLESVPPVLAQTQAGSAPAQVPSQPAMTAANTEIQTLNAAKTEGGKTVSMQFIEPVWLELRDKSGAAVITGMHKAGTGASVKADAPLLLIVGAAHAVKIKVEGKPLDLEPHTSGNIAKVKIQ